MHSEIFRSKMSTSSGQFSSGIPKNKNEIKNTHIRTYMEGDRDKANMVKGDLLLKRGGNNTHRYSSERVGEGYWEFRELV